MPAMAGFPKRFHLPRPSRITRFQRFLDLPYLPA
jgi:hypothetical protein